MSDKIADMIAQIHNGNHKFKESVDIPSSKLKVEIVKVLKEEGFIHGYRVGQEKGRSFIKLNFKYTPQKERVIQGIKRVSKPGLRIYRKSSEIPSLRNGLGTPVVSTSKGVMTGQKAREKKLGGEILCYVW